MKAPKSTKSMKSLVLLTTITLSSLTMAASPYRAPSNMPPAPAYFIPTNVEELHSVIVRMTLSDGRAACTAEYIGPTTLLSAAHCVIGTQEVGGMYLGKEKLEVLAVDVVRDVSILHTSQRNEHYLTIAGRDEKIIFKASMVAIGYGAGVFMISHPGMFFPENEVGLSPYNVNSSIGPTMGGMSGGTVLDLTTGKLTGIVQGGFTGGAGILEGRGIFVPAPVIWDVLDAAHIKVGK